MAGKNDNGRIIMVLSPAKTMDLRPLSERELSHVDAAAVSRCARRCEPPRHRACDAAMTRRICAEMKGKSEAELRSLLGLSPGLAKAAHTFWADFSTNDDGLVGADDEGYRPAIYTFSGPAFQGLSPSTCDAGTLSNLAYRLFVLDPVYGVLRSLQGMRPYRLEMGCKLFEPGTGEEKRQSLATHWRESVTEYLGAELSSGGDDREGPMILANLASEEYSTAIHPPSLPRNTVFLNVVFRHKGRVLAVHAKRARGLMARYIAEHGASTLKDVSQFDLENYRCVSETGDGTKWETLDHVGDNVTIVRIVFDREDAPPKETATKKRAAGSKKGGGRKAAGKRAKK